MSDYKKKEENARITISLSGKNLTRNRINSEPHRTADLKSHVSEQNWTILDIILLYGVRKF